MTKAQREQARVNRIIALSPQNKPRLTFAEYKMLMRLYRGASS